MARVSGRWTLKSMARMKPAVESRTARVHDVASSEWREEAICEGAEGVLKKRQQVNFDRLTFPQKGVLVFRREGPQGETSNNPDAGLIPCVASCATSVKIRLASAESPKLFSGGRQSVCSSSHHSVFLTCSDQHGEEINDRGVLLQQGLVGGEDE